jgi:uridine kinase
MSGDVRPSNSAISKIIAGAGPGLFGITGAAGSGKSYAGKLLCEQEKLALYSIDYRFIGDSLDRLALLNRKQARSTADFQDSANQFNWWDWSAINHDLAELTFGKEVVLESPYDRASGKKGNPLVILSAKKILVEGALLGPPSLVEKLTKIFFLVTPQSVRFNRIMEKDAGRRSFNEILARFLITEYSENMYYKHLFSWAEDKLVFIDALSGQPCLKPKLPMDLFIPFRVNY